MIRVDTNACIGCMHCYDACLLGLFQEEDGHAVFSPYSTLNCIKCGHCVIECPANALTPDFDYAVPEIAENILPETEKVAGLTDFLQRTRTVRHYEKKDVPEDILQKGIALTQYAPCSSNGRKVRWVVINGEDKVASFREKCRESYTRLSYCEKEKDIAERGKDIITCYAPCFIVTYADEGAFQPEADCAIAMTYADLYWQNAGLGSCWSAYGYFAVSRDPEIRRYLGIPENAVIGATMALGWADGPLPDKLPPRQSAVISWK